MCSKRLKKKMVRITTIHCLLWVLKNKNKIQRFGETLAECFQKKNNIKSLCKLLK